MIKGIIFDLDDTLFDCTGQLTAPARLRAAEILASTSDATTYYQQQETLSQIHGSSEAIRKLGSQNNIPSDIVEKALAAYNSDEVEAITPFPDVSETLSKLAQRNYKLVLVTSGHPERQKKKVHLLGLQNYFNETDNTLFLHDDRKNADKGPHLQMAAEHLSLPYHRLSRHYLTLVVEPKLYFTFLSENCHLLDVLSHLDNDPNTLLFFWQSIRFPLL